MKQLALSTKRVEVKIQLNEKFLKGIALQALQLTVRDLGLVFREVINEVGAFPGFPDSDIVDTGKLRDSQMTQLLPNGGIEINWETEYAMYVHEGYTLRNGNEQLGRPWIPEGLARFKFRETYLIHLNKLLNKYANKKVGMSNRLGVQKELGKLDRLTE